MQIAAEKCGRIVSLVQFCNSKTHFRSQKIIFNEVWVCVIWKCSLFVYNIYNIPELFIITIMPMTTFCNMTPPGISD